VISKIPKVIFLFCKDIICIISSEISALKRYKTMKAWMCDCMIVKMMNYNPVKSVHYFCLIGLLCTCNNNNISKLFDCNLHFNIKQNWHPNQVFVNLTNNFICILTTGNITFPKQINNCWRLSITTIYIYILMFHHTILHKTTKLPKLVQIITIVHSESSKGILFV
jgi:hypothetical protein